MKAEKQFMEIAISEGAKGSRKSGDIAIGAVVVKDGEVISKSGNRTTNDKDPSAHAEVSAIREACSKLGSKYLLDCVLYSTNEPCAMCASACVWAEMSGIVYGATAEDLKNYFLEKGETKQEYKEVEISCEEVLKRANPQIQLVKEFMRDECRELFKLY